MAGLVNLETMSIDPQEIFRLLEEADKKRIIFEMKISSLSSSLDDFRLKIESFDSIIEYLERESDRRSLVGMITRDGEYGLPIDFPCDLLDVIKLRKNKFSLKIELQEKEKKKLQDDISFILKDVELLKKIHYLDLKPSFFEDA